ncbi:single-stranded DNA-binding protein [Enterococcus hirae]
MLNNVTLVGRLTKDADLRYTKTGKSVATFTLAVNRNFTNQAGEREADFIHCVIWGKPAETLTNYTHKGTLLGVTGRIQTRSYENQQGYRVYVTEIFVITFSLLEPKAVNEQRQQTPPVPQPAVQSTVDPFDGYAGSMEIHDEDLPF